MGRNVNAAAVCYVEILSVFAFVMIGESWCSCEEPSGLRNTYYDESELKT